jgi:NDP-sugar pyrophosphorylase family protein
MGDLAIVYMVAGMSSRFLGKIKQFAIIGDNGETLIEHSLNQSLPAGFTKIVFIVGNKTEQPFKEKFGNNHKGVPVYYVSQFFDETKRDKPWGTTDALCSAQPILNCPFVVCNGDDLYGENSFKILVNHLKKENTCATLGFQLGETIPEKGKVNRGIFQIEGNFITHIKEGFNLEKFNLEERNLSENSLCSMNIFALQPKSLIDLAYLLEKFKEKNKEDRKIEALLPEDISFLITQNKLLMKLYPTYDVWMGITNPGDEDIVKEKLKMLKLLNSQSTF